MAETDVRKMSLFKLGWPIFIQCLLSLCLGYIDMLMITAYDENAVNGIGQANQILGFLTLAFTIISSAAGVMIAQYIGAKLKEKLNEIYTVSIFFNLILNNFIFFQTFIFYYVSQTYFFLNLAKRFIFFQILLFFLTLFLLLKFAKLTMQFNML